MKKSGPCKNCHPPKRQQGCHVYCEEGKAWEAQQKEEKEKIDKIKKIEKILNDYKIDFYVNVKKKDRK